MKKLWRLSREGCGAGTVRWQANIVASAPRDGSSACSFSMFSVPKVQCTASGSCSAAPTPSLGSGDRPFKRSQTTRDTSVKSNINHFQARCSEPRAATPSHHPRLTLLARPPNPPQSPTHISLGSLPSLRRSSPILAWAPPILAWAPCRPCAVLPRRDDGRPRAVPPTALCFTSARLTGAREREGRDERFAARFPAGPSSSRSSTRPGSAGGPAQAP